MSELYPVIGDIISLLNNKYGTDISAEAFEITAYTPKYDEDKKEFTKDDIKWIANILRSHTFSGGVRGLVKRMGDKFNNDLKQTIYDASRKYGDLEGVIKFLADYDNLKNKIPKGKSPAPTTPSQRLDISTPVQKVKGYLAKIKKLHPEAYKDSFYSYTDKVLDKINTYQRKGDRYPRLERELLGLFVGEGENPGLIKGWRRLKVPGITEAIKEIYEVMAPYVEDEVTHKKDILNPPKEFPLAPLENEIKQLGKDVPVVDEKEMEVNKEMKGERRDKIKEVVQDIPGNEKFKHALGFVTAYLKKAKTSYPKDFDKYSLHQYTDNLVSAMDEYAKSNGRDQGINKKIATIFTESPGILSMWDEIHKPISKRLRELKTAFASVVKTKKDAPSAIDQGLRSRIEALEGKTNLKVTDKDKVIAEGLLGKTEKNFPDPGKHIDPTFFNKLVKELIKHREDLPKKPGASDMDKLDLTDEEKKQAKAEEYLRLVGKTISTVDKILQDDEDVSDDDLVNKVLKKFKDEASKSDEKQKEDRKVVMDRDLSKEDEAAKNKPEVKQKESSINIISNYRESLFYRLERMANIAEDKLIKAELENIVQDIKQIL